MSNGTQTWPGLQSLSNAIANAEGFGVSGAIPTVANNPGNIALGDLGKGTLGQNISVYPDSTAGWNALNNQLAMIMNGQSNVYNPNMTLQQMGQQWAGGGQGSQNWVQNVAKYLGVDPNSTIGSILLGNPSTAQASGSSAAGSTGGGGGILGALQDYANMIRNPGGYAVDKAKNLIFSSRFIMLLIGLILLWWGGLGLIWVHGENIIGGATEPAHAAGRAARRVAKTAELFS